MLRILWTGWAQHRAEAHPEQHPSCTVAFPDSSVTMALSSKQCRTIVPVSPVVTSRARTCRVLCRAAQQSPQTPSRRESLGLLLSLPLLACGQSAVAAELADSRKFKGEYVRKRYYKHIVSDTGHRCCRDALQMSTFISANITAVRQKIFWM